MDSVRITESNAKIAVGESRALGGLDGHVPKHVQTSWYECVERTVDPHKWAGIKRLVEQFLKERHGTATRS